MNSPEPHGKEVDICMFVGSDHAGDKIPCRSRSGFLIYVNRALMHCFSKNQSTVEISVFGAKFVAMKQGIDALRSLRYKLRMMGITISGPSFICRDKCQMYIIHLDQSQYSERKVNQFAIMQSMSQLQWESPQLDMYPAKRMLQI